MGNPYLSTLKIDKDGWAVLEDKQGRVLAESNTAHETVVQAAFDRAGDCKIETPSSGTQFNFSAGFAGLKMKSELVIHSSYDVIFRVPSGYTGGCIVFDPTYNAGTLRNNDLIGGLTIQEQPPEQFQYSAIKYDGNMIDQGLTFGEFGNIHAFHCKRALELNFNAAGSWLTTFKWKKIVAYYTDILCEILNSSAQSPLGHSTCLFEYVSIQSAPNTAYGFKGMTGNNNVFTGCAVWDVQNSERGTNPSYPVLEPGDPNGVIASEFKADATNQWIMAPSIMTHSNFRNLAAKGQVRDFTAHGPVPQWEFYKFTYTTGANTNGSKTYVFPHNMGLKPTYVLVYPESLDASASPIRWSWDTTNIAIAFTGKTPPPPTPGNTNNLKFVIWCSVR